ncbi:MAG: carbohydrate-binding protein [Sphingobacteriaceae bacterium]|nr:MAG: carbohydrate-binding protein [Sphingobacteriaceae bacterium]
MKKLALNLSVFICFLVIPIFVSAQNPLITNQFTADPTARVFEGKVYVYPSHDIVATPKHGRVGWFCMEDYHVFSSENLTDWTDHGVIVSQNKVAWTDSAAYSMWAPECVFRNGKYYFYFPAPAKNKTSGNGFSIGVAIADKPYGPFVPESAPIKNVHGIDPNVFIDKDGQAYLYWAQGNIYAAKLKNNMLELDGEPKVLGNLPDKGLKEGPYLFERKGIYYLTYPHVENKIERLEYATSNNPMGPFKFTGVIMDESISGCWTNHQSIIDYKGQWYLFYHNDDLSPNFDKSRSIRADSLFFNKDGTIQKVMPTLRGVGITQANKIIQLDRYSNTSSEGVSVGFLDTSNKMQGWKVQLNQKNAWVRYNAVDFGKVKLATASAKTQSAQGGLLEIRIDKLDGTLLGSINVTPGSNWNLNKVSLANFRSGKHDLFVILKDTQPVQIDWMRFE